jgi:hypothetical protein
LPEPVLNSARRDKIKAEDVVEFRFTYPDGPHDAEALLVDAATGTLLIVTKEKGKACVFAGDTDLEPARGTVMLREICRLDVSDVSAGDISRDGGRIVLRTEERGWLWERNPGESLEAAFRRPPQVLAVRGSDQAHNGEAIGLHPNGNSYYTISEGRGEYIYQFSLAAASSR